MNPPDWNYVDLFDDWLESRAWGGPAPRERLSRKVGEQYRLIWNGWVRWLTTTRRTPAGDPARPRRSYVNAASDDIDAFLLHGVAPSTTRGRRPTSQITVMRYGMLLEQIYEHAANRGILERNPARDRTIGTLREMRMRQMDPAGEGQIITSNQWVALRSALPPSNDPDPMLTRDRAMLMLLMECLITSGELCALNLDDLKRVTDPGKRKRYALSLDGSRAAQQRTLMLSAPLSETIAQWLELRESLGVPTKQAALFVTDRKNRNRISKRVVFHVVATLFHRATARGYALPNHVGPQVLRNTGIVARLRSGQPPHVVARDVGMKDARSFRGLMVHLTA